MTDLKKGDRVQLSEAGMNALRPRRQGRIGTIANNPQHVRAKYVNVKWDGTRTVSVGYLPSFIEKAATDWDALRERVTEQYKCTLAYLARDDG